MKCPSCNHDVAAGTVHGEAVDTCSACGGIWLETGELRPFLERILAHSPELATDAATPAKAPPVGAFYKSGRNCPACGRQMDKGYYAYDSGIVIEHCVPCGGTWVDASNLEPLVAFIQDNTRPIEYADTTPVEHSGEDEQIAKARLVTISPALGIAFAAVCLIVLGVVSSDLYHMNIAVKLGEASNDWLETEGTIQAVTSRVTTGGIGRRRSNVYNIKRSYTYVFEGTSYQGDATWPNGDDFMTTDANRVRVLKGLFEPGSKTTVYVDPKDPTRSSLRQGVNPNRNIENVPFFIGIAVLSGMGVLMGIWMVIKGYRLSLIPNAGAS